MVVGEPVLTTGPLWLLPEWRLQGGRTVLVPRGVVIARIQVRDPCGLDQGSGGESVGGGWIQDLF